MTLVLILYISLRHKLVLLRDMDNQSHQSKHKKIINIHSTGGIAIIMRAYVWPSVIGMYVFNMYMPLSRCVHQQGCLVWGYRQFVDVYHYHFPIGTLLCNGRSCSPLCQTYKPTIISNQISKTRTSIQERWQVVNPRHETPQGQSVANPELPCRIS